MGVIGVTEEFSKILITKSKSLVPM